MSFLQPRLSQFSLLAFVSRLFRTGAQSAVMTPFQRLDAVGPLQGDVKTGWDLIREEHRVRATGAKILHLFGEVISFDGKAIPDAIIEIRQCDMYGQQLVDQRHTSDFYGLGRTETDFEGRYQFRTILPAPDCTRSTHIEAYVTPVTGRKLATKLYFLNNSANEQDWNYQALGPSRQAAVTLDPIKRPDGDLEAGFNFVL